MVKLSVDWWNTLHPPVGVFKMGVPGVDPSMLWPLLLMTGAFKAFFFTVWLLRTRASVAEQRRAAKDGSFRSLDGGAMRPLICGERFTRLGETIMALGNSTTGYGCVSRVVHWGAVLLVAGAFGLAWTMTKMAGSPEKFRLYGIHKSVGALILGLGLLRILWTMLQPAPRPLGNLAPWQLIAAKAVHGLLLL